MDANGLRARAAEMRTRADRLEQLARTIKDPAMVDAYTAIIAEYDALALQLERMADDFRP
jgi:hypothetical protein